MTGAIRRAGAGDAGAIAALHVVGMRTTYHGILPDRYLESEIEAERRAAWVRFFAAPPPGAAAFIAAGVRSLDGFIAFQHGAEAGYDAVIENLHVAPGARGRGLGKRLLRVAAEYMIAAGLGAVCLWVYDDNPAAIRFYTALGGVIDAHGTDPFAGADALHSRIGWHDLTVLRDRCG